MAQYDDLHTGTITFVGVIAGILTFVIIAAAQVLYYQYQATEIQRKEIDAPLALSDSVLDGQRDVLNSYTWIDQEKGIVSIPIQRAMSDVLKSLQTATTAPAEPASETP